MHAPSGSVLPGPGGEWPTIDATAKAALMADGATKLRLVVAVSAGGITLIHRASLNLAGLAATGNSVGPAWLG